MNNTENLLEKHEDDMWRCAHCSLCKYPPLMNVRSARFAQVCCSIDYGLFHAFSGGGKLNIAHSFLEGRINKISDELRDVIFQCSLCGACDVSCKYSTNIELLKGIFDLRRYIVEKFGPQPVHTRFADLSEKFNNPYGEEHEKRQSWIDETSVNLDSDSSTLFYTGCTSAYRQQDMVKASVEILKLIGVDFNVSKDEYCCGSPIFRSGLVNRAKKFFKYNIELFDNLGINKVITACPGCYSMFLAQYPAFLEDKTLEKWKKIDFLHMTEVIAEAIRKKKLKFKDLKDKPIITYHDPCHLGRGAEPYVPKWEGTKRKVFNQITIYEPPKTYRRGGKGVYDAPRRIFKKMKKNIGFFEMFRIAEYAYCCGSGAGVKAAYPDMAISAASERLQEAEYVLNKAESSDPDINANNQKLLISACPFCKTNFEDAIEKTDKDIKYMDINQFVLERIEK
ncbi:MAG: hypothetical protein GF329_22700 [Candidatus Lokiarchaeota archaeon]|nr:hypothetical protein [Candidatus Lokiarchaeota archaeon]